MSSTRNVYSARKVFCRSSLDNRQVANMLRKTAVPTYATFAAAVAGGTQIGDLYQLSGFEEVLYYAGPGTEPSPAIPAVLSVQTTGAAETFTLPTATYSSVVVTWGDGDSDTLNTTGAPTHEYATAGIYTVTLHGVITDFAYNNGAGKTQLIEVQTFGEQVTYAAGAFKGCSSLTAVSSADLPVFASTSLSEFFSGCTLLEDADYSAWDVSTITDFSYMFYACTTLTGAMVLDGWDVSSATTLEGMFDSCSAFDADLSTWTLPASGCDGTGLFRGTAYTGADIALWGWSFGTAFNVASYMFAENATLTAMPTTTLAAATLVNSAFSQCTALAPSTLTLNVSAATNAANLFYGCTSLNPSAMTLTLNTSSTFSAASMFSGCTAFTGADIDTMDVTKCTSLSAAFTGTAVTTANYDAALAAWAALTVQSGVTLSVLTTTYTDATSRGVLTGTYTWTITDGGFNYAPYVLSLSPLVFYKLEETSGTTCSDSSGNGYHGTYGSNAQAKDYDIGTGVAQGTYKSLTADIQDTDANSAIVLPTSAGLSGIAYPVTISCWLYLDGASQVDGKGIFNFPNMTSPFNFLHYPSNTSLFPNPGSLGSAIITNTGTPYDHLVLVFASTTSLTVYKNGSSVTTVNPAGDATFDFRSMRYGSVSSSASYRNWSKGALADLAIFTTALTPTQISTMYTLGSTSL